MHISGENFQQLADIYLGTPEDFMYNPVINKQSDKHLNIYDVCTLYHNPPILFLYPHHLRIFANKLQYFCNPFTLITHNSDTNIVESDPDVQTILQCPLLQKWWAQNLCFIHHKMHFLPIGIANSMWEHGNINMYKTISTKKTHDIYNNFNIYTNVAERQECADAMESRASMLPMVSAKDNVERLAKYKYCLCPEGNGVDTHRLWEALYLECVPIVKNTPFIKVINHYTNGELGLVAVDSWWDFNLPESNIRPDKKWLTLEHYAKMIRI